MSTKPKRKLLNPNQSVEQLGLIFIQKFAHEIRAIWRPTPNDDYGLDGELELTDGGEVTGYIIKVQLKSGRSYLRNETPSSFDYYTGEADLAYWANVTAPVILIIYDPEGEAGYWIDIKRYLRENADSAGNTTIHFIKRKTRLTAESFLTLCETAIEDEVERTEFLVGRIRERLHSNLIPIVAFPPAVYKAEVSARRLAERAEDHGGVAGGLPST